MTLNDLAAEAWLYFYPLLLMQVTLEAEDQYQMNTWTHARTLRGADFTDVIRPNVDTIYSHAWLDLSGGPVLLTMPDMNERYFVVQAVDEWSRTFAIAGTRTTGNREGKVLYVPEGYSGGFDQWPGAMIEICPTEYVWLLMRIQSDAPDNVSGGEQAICQLQEQFSLETPGGGDLALPGRHTKLPMEQRLAIETGTPPPIALRAMDLKDYFTWAACLWGSPSIKVPEGDHKFVEQMKTLGINPGQPLDWDALTPEQRAALGAAKENALARLASEAADQGGANLDGWYYLKDNWYAVEGRAVVLQQPTNYTLRAALSMEALAYLPVQEAVYTSAGVSRVGGDVLNGANGAAFAITFKKGELPPVGAFWSLTVYSNAGYFVPNALNRYTIGSRDALVPGKDGSLTVILSSEPPDQTENWLPIPGGLYTLSFRAYLPKRSIVHDGSGWQMPPITAL